MQSFQRRQDELVTAGTSPVVQPPQVHSLIHEDTSEQPTRDDATLPTRNSTKSRLNQSVESRVLPVAASPSVDRSTTITLEQPLLQAVAATETNRSTSASLRLSNSERNLSALQCNSQAAGLRTQTTTENDDSNQRHKAMIERFQVRRLPSFSSRHDLIRGVRTTHPTSDADVQFSHERSRRGSGLGTTQLDREPNGSSLVAEATDSTEGEDTNLFSRKKPRASFRRSNFQSGDVHEDDDELLDRVNRGSPKAHTSLLPSIVDKVDQAYGGQATEVEAPANSVPDRHVVFSALSNILSPLKRPLSPIGTWATTRFTVLAVALVIYCVWLPFKIAFVGYSEDSCLDWLDLPVEFSFLLDSLLNFNTAFVNGSGELVMARSRIAWDYLTGWFLLDMLSSVPLRLVFSFDPDVISAKRMVNENSIYDGVMRSGRLVHTFVLLRFVWLIRMHRAGNTRSSWLLYSPSSHLLRIWGLIAMIILLVHYVACIWRLLSPPLLRPYPSRAEDYTANFNAALQLLQDQGPMTQTAMQSTFASYAFVAGSMTLALVFSHVAILIPNSNANTTSYERKMVTVFSVMNELQLPVVLRERIQEYYEYLWREYESLDGKIVGFSEGLTHSLGIEVALFKYMELVIHVPYWLDCSTDFQKQLILRLQVRVYLPDDFVIRQGEVGDEMYMINLGQCELVATVNKTTTEHPVPTILNQPPSEKPTKAPTSQCRAWTITNPPSSAGFTSVLRQGQWFGELALIMNHQRSADVRAATFVEMCVLKREDFQTIITRYPQDRMRVIERLMLTWMKKNEAYGTACPMMRMVQEVYEGEEMSLEQAAKLITQGIEDDGLDNDDTLLFGIDSHLKQRVEVVQAQVAAAGGVPNPYPSAPVVPQAPVLPEDDLEMDSEAMTTIRQRMVQMEESQRAMVQVMRELGMELTQLHNTQEQIYGVEPASAFRHSSHRE